MTSCYSVQQDKNASCRSKVWAVDCENTINGLAQGTEEHLLVLQRLTDRLTKQEQVRASRYSQVSDSLRFATGRAAIRSLIKNSNVSSEHCRNALELPEPLINSPNDGSKPSLDESSRLIYKNIADFNISHDGDWVLAGIANRGIIGIDVARVYCPEELSVDQYINEFSFQVINESATTVINATAKQRID
ncbi:hypothetical protein FB645_005030 [Coemansia sp. IMI 203386]|nr:hypothetical protein FB645_005030 [Coemansia sp. IMI 203386]